MQTLSNNDLQALGTKAVALWNKGDQGDAIAIFLMYHATQACVFEAKVLDKEGNPERVFSFTVSEFADKNNSLWRKADGTRDNKANNAAFTAMADRLFKINDPTAAQKQRIMRAIRVAIPLANEFPGEQVTLDNRNRLKVPFVALNARPDEDKKPNDAAVYDAMADKGASVTLDGRGGNTLAALNRRLNPGDQRTPEQKGQEPAQQLSTAIDFITGSLESLMSDDAPDNVASLNNDALAKLAKLVAVGSAYLEAARDDDGEEEPEQQPRRRRA